MVDFPLAEPLVPNVVDADEPPADVVAPLLLASGPNGPRFLLGLALDRGNPGLAKQ